MFKKYTTYFIAVFLVGVLITSTLGTFNVDAQVADPIKTSIDVGDVDYGEVREYKIDEIQSRAKDLINPDNQKEFLIEANYAHKFWRKICVRWIWVPSYSYTPYPPYYRLTWRKVCLKWVWVPIYYPILVLPPKPCYNCPVVKIPINDLIINPEDPILKGVKLDRDVFQKGNIETINKEILEMELER
jgi:hypothetical protein